jgi:hypothetical protein
VTLYYLGTSAVLKLLRAEEHSRAMATFYDEAAVRALGRGVRRGTRPLVRTRLRNAGPAQGSVSGA